MKKYTIIKWALTIVLSLLFVLIVGSAVSTVGKDGQAYTPSWVVVIFFLLIAVIPIIYDLVLSKNDPDYHEYIAKKKKSTMNKYTIAKWIVTIFLSISIFSTVSSMFSQPREDGVVEIESWVLLIPIALFITIPVIYDSIIVKINPHYFYYLEDKKKRKQEKKKTETSIKKEGSKEEKEYIDNMHRLLNEYMQALEHHDK